MNGTLWTEERDAQLRELRKQGFSSTQIAVKLGGVSRSAVIGRANRMGYAANTHTTALPVLARAQRAAIAFRTQRTPFKGPVMTTPRISLPPPTIEWQAGEPVTLLDLEPHHCRWPVHDVHYAFCGAGKLKGRSYCEGHCRLAYR